MDSMNIALPESMKEYVQAQVAAGGYSSASEYIRELIRSDRKEKAREALEAEILKGLESGQPAAMGPEDWDRLRGEVQRRHTQRSASRRSS